MVSFGLTPCQFEAQACENQTETAHLAPETDRPTSRPRLVDSFVSCLSPWCLPFATFVIKADPGL